MRSIEIRRLDWMPYADALALQRALVPFYTNHRMRWQNYSGLLYGWLVENHAPHTNWAARGEVNEARDVVAPAGGHVGAVDLSRSDSAFRNTH